MNDREKFLILMALTFMQANIDAVNETFRHEDDEAENEFLVKFNDSVEPQPEHEELDVFIAKFALDNDIEL